MRDAPLPPRVITEAEPLSAMVELKLGERKEKWSTRAIVRKIQRTGGACSGVLYFYIRTTRFYICFCVGLRVFAFTNSLDVIP